MPLPKPKPPVGIVFDCDLGNRIDAALALALLYGFDGKNEIRVVSVSVSKSNLKAAALADAISHFYTGASSGAFGGFGRTLPVGLSTDGFSPEDTPMLTATLAMTSPDGSPLFQRNIEKLNDTAEPTALIRNAFTAQHDQNCIVVLAGPANNLDRVLALHGGKDLIKSKVRYLAVTEAAFRLPASRKLFADWPTPVFIAREDTGKPLYPASSIEKDFSWSPTHPVAVAYRSSQPMPYDAPTTDMAAVLYAVRPQEGYFKPSDRGTLEVLDDGSTKFTASAEGKHCFLVPDPAQQDRILKLYTELASAKPVPKKRPIPPKVDDDKDDKDEKADKPEAKDKP